MAEKRTIRIEPAPGTACVQFAWNGGGELPDALKGMYTSPAAAKRALTDYNARAKDALVLAEKGTPAK